MKKRNKSLFDKVKNIIYLSDISKLKKLVKIINLKTFNEE